MNLEENPNVSGLPEVLPKDKRYGRTYQISGSTPKMNANGVWYDMETGAALSPEEATPFIKEWGGRSFLGQDTASQEQESSVSIDKIYGNNAQQAPVGAATSPTGGSPLQQAVNTAAGATSGNTEKDALLNKLVDALAKSQPAGGSLEQGYKDLYQEKVAPVEQQIGTFDQEIQKSQSLLADLDSQIRRGMNSEEARLAPMELVTGRQAELQRQSGETRQDLLGAIDKLQTGRALSLQELSRKEQNIITQLGFREADLDRPLDQFLKELSAREAIKDLTQKDVPNVVTSAYNEKGDLTIVFQDPETGAITSQTVSGVGPKAAKYDSFTTQVNENGDLTIIGIGADGKTSVVGKYNGVAPASSGGGTTGEQYTLSPGAQRYDNEGNLVAENPSGGGTASGGGTTSSQNAAPASPGYYRDPNSGAYYEITSSGSKKIVSDANTMNQLRSGKIKSTDRPYTQSTTGSSTPKSSSGGGTVSNRTQEVLDGEVSLNELNSSERKTTEAQLKELGLYSSKVAPWYIEYMSEQYKQSFTASALQKDWDEYRNGIIGGSSSSSSGRTV